MTVFVSCSPARVAPRWLLVAFAFVVAIAAYPVEAASGDYPADPPGDVTWPWSDWAPAGIETIMEKFNAARAQDPTISVDLVIEYTQDEWDSLSDNQKGLYLSNKERVDRGIAPYAAVARQVSDVAQDYATYLLEVEETLAHETTDAKWTGSGRDASFCCDPYDRLAAALGDEKEFFEFSENLAWASAGTASTFPEPVAYSVYAWIYDDSGSSWGHRHFSLAELNDNAGEANLEGLAGFGVARGADGTYTVMNVADEAAGWDHASDSNIVLWSLMVGGADGTNGDAPASDPSPSPSDPSPSPSEDSGANGGLIAAIVVVVATLLIAFATSRCSIPRASLRASSKPPSARSGFLPLTERRDRGAGAAASYRPRPKRRTKRENDAASSGCLNEASTSKRRQRRKRLAAAGSSGCFAEARMTARRTTAKCKRLAAAGSSGGQRFGRYGTIVTLRLIALVYVSRAPMRSDATRVV